MTQNNLIKKSGWWILSILSIIPLVLWIFQLPLDERFSNLPLFIRSLGDITGLCGMAMFSLVIILSARLKFFEHFFNGINQTYIAHHVFGGLALCLLLFHPLFLAYNYLLVSFNSAALFLLPSNNFVKNAGILGLIIMIITLVITFYTKLKYQTWKFTHKFLGLAFIFAFLHTFLVGADIASNILLKYYLLVLGILAISSYIYRVLLADYLVKSFEYTVKDIKCLPDKIWEIEFKPVNKEIKFNAGQFVFMNLYNSNFSKEIHPFSISSAPDYPLKIAIKELGDYTNKLNSLKVGDLVKFEGAFGNFNYKKYSNKNQIWIAGGIGITPFLSMLRSITEKDFDYKIDLYYSVKDENCLTFKEELEEIAKKYSNINIIIWNTKESKFLSVDYIKTITKDLFKKDILICGPPIMMSTIKNQLIKSGIHKNNIHTEEFNLY